MHALDLDSGRLFEHNRAHGCVRNVNLGVCGDRPGRQADVFYRPRSKPASCVSSCCRSMCFGTCAPSLRAPQDIAHVLELLAYADRQRQQSTRSMGLMGVASCWMAANVHERRGRACARPSRRIVAASRHRRCALHGGHDLGPDRAIEKINVREE